MWHSDERSVEFVLLEYYKNIFTTRNPGRLNDILDIMHEKMSPSIRSFLDKEFTSVEIEEALFQMHPRKSPGSDGMTVMFYQKY